MARDLIIKNGPSKDGLRDALFEAATHPHVTFHVLDTAHDTVPVNVAIYSVEREDLGGHTWEFTGAIVDERGMVTHDVSGMYQSHLRVGAMHVREVA